MTQISHRSCAFCWLLVSVAVGLPALAQTGTFLDKLDPTDVRVVSYNLGGFNDGFSDQPFNFTGGQWRFDDHYARIVGALDADVWAFQEIQNRTAADVQSAMNLADPLPGGASWFTFKQSRQVIASRHPFSDTFAFIGGSPRQPTVATVDLPDAWTPRDLHLVNVHLKAGGTSSDEAQRIDAVDRIQQYFREAQQPGDPDEIAFGTPTVFLGDFNTAAGLNPVFNLLFGDVINEASFGPDQPLDWDGTALEAVQPDHNLTSSNRWTFRSSSGFTSRLDYQLYTDSTAKLAQAFVLNTTLMSAAELAATGLQSLDVLYNPSTGLFDHLPVVADYNLRVRIIPEPAAAMVGLVLIVVGRRRRVGRTMAG